MPNIFRVKRPILGKGKWVSTPKGCGRLQQVITANLQVALQNSATALWCHDLTAEDAEELLSKPAAGERLKF